MKYNIKKNRISVLWIIALLEIAYLAAYLLVDGKNIIDSDMSAEMVLGSILNRDHAFILANNWFYSTELRVLNSQLYYRLFLAIFPTHWHIARIGATVAMHLTLAGGIYYLAKKMNVKDLGAAAAVLAFCPFGGEYNWIVTIGCFYTIPVAIAFYTPALLTDIAETQRTKRRRIIAGIMLAFLAFQSGAAGVRYLMVCSGPLFLTMLIFVCRQYIKGVNMTTTSETFRKLLISLAILFVSGAGYIVNIRVLSKDYTFLNISGANLSDFDLTKFITSLGKLCELLGWRSGNAFSTLGLQSALALILFALTCTCFLYFIKHREDYSENEYIVSLYSGISLFLGIIAITVTDWNDIRYAIPGLMLSFLAMDIAFHKWIESLGKDNTKNVIRLGRIRFCAGILLVAIVLGYCIKPNMVFYKAERTKNLRNAVYYLIQNDLTKGYATVFNSNIPTELSNGQIEIWTMQDIEDKKAIELREFLQDKKHINKPEGKVFVLLDTEENALAPSYARMENLVYDNSGYFIYVYDSADELFETTNTRN